MVRTAPQRHTISAGSTRLLAFIFTDDLPSGVVLTGTPTVDEVGADVLTITNVAVNTATFVDDNTGDTIAIGHAVQALVSGGTAGTEYQLRCTVSNDASPAETYVGDVIVRYD